VKDEIKSCYSGDLLSVVHYTDGTQKELQEVTEAMTSPIAQYLQDVTSLFVFP
jgi:hypothetical protein